MRRGVVTGIGLVTPLAGTADRTWELLIQGKSGVGPITRFDASDLSCRIAGEVIVVTENNQFDAEKYVSSKDMRKMDDFIIYGMGAAIQAIED